MHRSNLSFIAAFHLAIFVRAIDCASAETSLGSIAIRVLLLTCTFEVLPEAQVSGEPGRDAQMNYHIRFRDLQFTAESFLTVLLKTCYNAQLSEWSGLIVIHVLEKDQV